MPTNWCYLNDLWKPIVEGFIATRCERGGMVSSTEFTAEFTKHLQEAGESVPSRHATQTTLGFVMKGLHYTKTRRLYVNQHGESQPRTHVYLGLRWRQ